MAQQVAGSLLPTHHGRPAAEREARHLDLRQHARAQQSAPCFTPGLRGEPQLGSDEVSALRTHTPHIRSTGIQEKGTVLVQQKAVCSTIPSSYPQDDRGGTFSETPFLSPGLRTMMPGLYILSLRISNSDIGLV